MKGKKKKHCHKREQKTGTMEFRSAGRSKKEADSLYSHFSYDDAYRTMESECTDLVIPFVNYFFHENYGEETEVVRLRNEHFIGTDGQAQKKKVTDSYMEFVEDDGNSRYHIECESGKYDDSLLLKLFEYDTRITVDSAEYKEAKLEAVFPHTGLFILRKGKDMPHEATFEIHTPGGSVSYGVPVMYESDFTLEDIFEKKLFFLLPFYIFNLENEFERMEEDADRLERFSEEMDRMLKKLEEEADHKELSGLSYGIVVRLIHQVAHKLTINKEKINGRIGEIMGGKVLDLDVIRAYHEGQKQGKQQGIEQGIEQESKRTEEERKRAEKECMRAEEERERADRAERKIKELEAILAGK